MSKPEVTYTLPAPEALPTGWVSVYVDGRIIANLGALTLLRRSAAGWLTVLDHPRWMEYRLGILTSYLPAGVTTKDILFAYMVARDELLDLGLTVDS